MEVKAATVVVEDVQEIKRAYANYVTVTTTATECNITFCRIEPLAITPEKVKATVVSKIMLPLNLVEDVIGVIKTNFEKVTGSVHVDSKKE